MIRAQARKELEAELAAGAEGAAPPPPGPRVTELEMAPNLAVSGVYYRCPIIGERGHCSSAVCCVDLPLGYIMKGNACLHGK